MGSNSVMSSICVECGTQCKNGVSKNELSSYCNTILIREKGEFSTRWRQLTDGTNAGHLPGRLR